LIVEEVGNIIYRRHREDKHAAVARRGSVVDQLLRPFFFCWREASISKDPPFPDRKTGIHIITKDAAMPTARLIQLQALLEDVI
jgi:hypothetical protein